MSYADRLFAKNCATIISDGCSDKSLDVRAHWADGTPAHTKKILYVQDRYDLSDGSIPVITLRKQGFKNCVDEILWIYQKKSNDVRDLHSHIWDQWTLKDSHTTNHIIGKAYGYQIAQKFRHHKASEMEMKIWEDEQDIRAGLKAGTIDPFSLVSPIKAYVTTNYPSFEVKDGYVWFDQMDAVLYDLINNPGSRRIMTNTYNHADLADMGLAPCAYQMVFNVTFDKDGNKILNGCLNQRSQDMLTANGWNVMQYSILLHMVAIHCNMKPGIFVHNIFDCHIYDRHIPIVQDMLVMYSSKVVRLYDNGKTPIDEVISDCPYPNPKLWINPEKKNFYDFTVDDFRLEDYQYCDFNPQFEVAI